jgi:hypothetical protein
MVTQRTVSLLEPGGKARTCRCKATFTMPEWSATVRQQSNRVETPGCDPALVTPCHQKLTLYCPKRVAAPKETPVLPPSRCFEPPCSLFTRTGGPLRSVIAHRHARRTKAPCQSHHYITPVTLSIATAGDTAVAERQSARNVFLVRGVTRSASAATSHRDHRLASAHGFNRTRSNAKLAGRRCSRHPKRCAGHQHSANTRDDARRCGQP